MKYKIKIHRGNVHTKADFHITIQNFLEMSSVIFYTIVNMNSKIILMVWLSHHNIFLN